MAHGNQRKDDSCKPLCEDDTKDDALYRLLDETVKVARETDPGNSKILVFANTLTLGRRVAGMLAHLLINFGQVAEHEL